MTDDEIALAVQLGPVAQDCEASAVGGIVVSNHGTSVSATCGCGHPLAAASRAGLIEAFCVHLMYRMAQ